MAKNFVKKKKKEPWNIPRKTSTRREAIFICFKGPQQTSSGHKFKDDCEEENSCDTMADDTSHRLSSKRNIKSYPSTG
jgi:hypothetical protein